MSDFFHTNPLFTRYAHGEVGRFTSKRGYDIVDQAGRRLAHAHEDLGTGVGQRLWSEFAQHMTNSCRFVVDDAWQQRLLALDENRGRRRTTISVAGPVDQHLGAVTMSRLDGTARSYQLSDAYERQWGQIIKHDPNQGRGVLGRLANRTALEDRPYTATDHQGNEVARITDTKRRDTSRGYETHVSDHVLQLHYTQLPEPLSTLLRAATVALDFAEFHSS
ncbi:hypothetical protein F4561_003095 [Lipingzhangella halophila]|uniref:Uncharacterized protein n=1 Tax=Lipingzhangella halophila TaxID=1783352 RepID=A0A7W7RHX0_9ACTN|nr:hypothetical protein [Lipingzhangella halophila]MBB4932275.1 hypothetical protein [Lipingzhangella halophila]